MTTATLEKLEKETERLETKTNDMERIYNINIVNFEERLKIRMDAMEVRLGGKVDGIDKKLDFLQWFITVGLSVGFGFVGLGVATIGVLIAHGQGLF